MPILSSATVERRAVPRVDASLAGELASGTVLVSVVTRNVSIRGCCVVVAGAAPGLPGRPGGRGLLRLLAANAGAGGIILPVVLRNAHSEPGMLVYGLEFAPLMAHQSRALVALLETVVSAGQAPLSRGA